MFIDVTKRLINTDNPSLIEWMVLQALEDGEDLCDAPFIFNGEFCQWVTQRESMYVYKLVSAHSPSEFFNEVRRMNAQGFELAFQQVVWHGMLCQWMAKVKGHGVDVENASAYAGAVLPTSEVLTPMPGFSMVAGVHVLGGLSSLKFLPRNERENDLMDVMRRLVEIARLGLSTVS